MNHNFIEELEWRGMIQDIIPGTKEYLQENEYVPGYLGVDPTADSLHIGHLCGIMMLRYFQMCGHKPIILVGGATGMIGDPSGKSEERNLLSPVTIEYNIKAIKKQLEKFLDFDESKPNSAIIVNNLDWLGNMTFLDFARNIGKLVTVNYMMSKDSVKKRITSDNGISFTEFTYQLLQGFDFCHLHDTFGCMIQLGGSDQWGNMTTGLELLRKMTGEDAYAITCPLLTKSDGNKFGKTEKGTIWLDPKKTSPYEFYQFWINQRDEDVEKYLKIFTTYSEDEIKEIIEDSKEHPELRLGQIELAQYITHLVHGNEELKRILDAQDLLYSKDEDDFLHRPETEQIDTLEFLKTVIPHFEVSIISTASSYVDVLSDFTHIFPSRNEARKAIEAGSVSIWGQKITEPYGLFDCSKAVAKRYYLVKFGKKKHYLIIEKKI